MKPNKTNCGYKHQYIAYTDLMGDRRSKTSGLVRKEVEVEEEEERECGAEIKKKKGHTSTGN